MACLAGAWLFAGSTSQADEFVNSVGIKMIRIGPGSFEMGSTLGRDYWDEQPVHKVTISSAFYISQTEVTAKQLICGHCRAFALRSGR
jgi:formylglycine-generating enzyme required for sulfatase activity